MLEYSVARAGFIKGARLAEFIATWAIASRSLGRSITTEDLVEWWEPAVSRRTAYYRLSDFREAFPELESPQPIADLLLARVDADVSANRLASVELDLGDLVMA